MERKAMARRSVTARSGCTQGWRRALGGPTSRDSWARCPQPIACSCISGYVHCTEIVFLPMPPARASNGPSSVPGSLFPWVGAGFQRELPTPSPAAPGCPAACPTPGLAAEEPCPGTAGRRQRVLLGSSGQTRLKRPICPLVHAGCVPLRRSEGLLRLYSSDGKKPQRLRNIPPTLRHSCKHFVMQISV